MISEILKAQQTDESLQEILNEPSSDKLPYKIREDGLVLIHDKIYVPDDPGIHLLILKRKHDHVLAGHPGITNISRIDHGHPSPWTSSKNFQPLHPTIPYW